MRVLSEANHTSFLLTFVPIILVFRSDDATTILPSLTSQGSNMIERRNYESEQTVITKEEITIKVPSEVAESYRNATEEEREQIEARIAVLLKSSMTSRLEAIAKLRQTMDEIGTRAVQRGLTPEILESILNDDE
ncbi:hypothetical protein [Iningainema tapete]